MTVMSLDDYQNYGWTKTDWTDQQCTEDATELLLNDDINVDKVIEYDEYEYDTSSDEEL